MRTFIAIDLTQEIKTKITEYILKLAKYGAQIRWVREEGMHLTLKFLGEISQDKVQKVQSLLQKISEHHGPFSLKLIGTGTFPRERRNIRVIWIGVEDSPQMMKLQEEIEEKLDSIGFPKENRPFHPHLTLGRVKSTKNIQPVLQELAKQSEICFGDMNVGKISLFQSILKPSGAEYSVLSEFKLK